MEEFLFIIGLILLNGLFSMSEVALISARKTRLTAEAEKGNLSAKAALKLTKEPNLFLSTVQIGITLIGILTGIYSGNKIAQQFTAILEEWSVNSIYAHYIAQCIIVIIVTYLTILFGELLPKRIGMSYAESVARIVARPMLFLSHLAYPCVLLLSRSTTFVYKMIGMKENDTKVTEEEIKTMIQEGAEDGEVQPMEQDIMQRVLMIGDLNILRKKHKRPI
ncbi:MAG: DUF21 domain-containing protein [Bacteroidaceae bacterium]|nr:DUF21 domain-containing protein [Bacteroidaceae bacterium]